MNCNHEGIGEPGCYVCDPDKGRVISALRAEVERLRAELENEHANGPTAREWAESRAEVERLRGLIAEVEWEGDRFGSSSCPWCGGWESDDPPHAPDCPAFSARGEVRR